MNRYAMLIIGVCLCWLYIWIKLRGAKSRPNIFNHITDIYTERKCPKFIDWYDGFQLCPDHIGTKMCIYGACMCKCISVDGFLLMICFVGWIFIDLLSFEFWVLIWFMRIFFLLLLLNFIVNFFVDLFLFHFCFRC